MNDVKVNIPKTNGEANFVDLDLFLTSLIPLRVYLLFRYFSFYSSWADDRAEKICNECSTLGGISFAIKAELKERPFTMVGVLMILSIMIFGYALRNVEVAFMQNRPENKFQDWTYEWNGFWCIIITILTVGYGDFYPQTHVGRIIAVVACLWGTFLISLIVLSLNISVEFTSQESKSYDELKKGEMLFELKKKAIQTLRYSIRLKNYQNMEDVTEEVDKIKYIKTIDQLKKNLSEFRTARKFFISKEHEVSALNILYRIHENVSVEMEDIIMTANDQVNSLLQCLELSQTIQEEIKEYTNKLDTMTKTLEESIPSETT